MNEGDYVIVGRWDSSAQAYLEYVGYIRHTHSSGLASVAHSNGHGGYDKEHVKPQADAVEGEDYYRPYEGALDEQNPLQGQPVWVSYAQWYGGNSKILRGFILSSPSKYQGGLSISLRVVFYDTSRNRDKVRTLVPQAQALLCDSFWAAEEPQPVYCADDD